MNDKLKNQHVVQGMCTSKMGKINVTLCLPKPYQNSKTRPLLYVRQIRYSFNTFANGHCTGYQSVFAKY